MNLVSCVLVSLIGADPVPALTYAEALEQANIKGEVLIVHVGAEWCPACKKMEDEVIPAVKKSTSLQNTVYTHIDTDKYPVLASQVMDGTSIPQTVMYKKTQKGWIRRCFSGLLGRDRFCQEVDSIKNVK